jgi:hypothetical protein
MVITKISKLADSLKKYFKPFLGQCAEQNMAKSSLVTIFNMIIIEGHLKHK